MIEVIVLLFTSVLIHVAIKDICSQNHDNFFMQLLAGLLRSLGFESCVTCNRERVMFLPDEQLPCWTFVECLKSNEESASRPCRRNGRECAYYHGWPNEKPCALAEVLRTLSKAEKVIYLCMYSFTNKNLSDFLKFLKKNKNIRVHILTDRQRQQPQENDQIPDLEGAGFHVRYNPEHNKFLMHNKFCIVDKRVMISGSANWTHAAFKNNDEMMIWIENPRIIEEVSRKFERCFNRGSSNAQTYWSPGSLFISRH